MIMLNQGGEKLNMRFSIFKEMLKFGKLEKNSPLVYNQGLDIHYLWLKSDRDQISNLEADTIWRNVHAADANRHQLKPLPK